MFSFLMANNFTEHNILKGFIPNLSATLEHKLQTSQMTHIISTKRG